MWWLENGLTTRTMTHKKYAVSLSMGAYCSQFLSVSLSLYEVIGLMLCPHLERLNSNLSWFRLLFIVVLTCLETLLAEDSVFDWYNYFLKVLRDFFFQAENYSKNKIVHNLTTSQIKLFSKEPQVCVSKIQIVLRTRSHLEIWTHLLPWNDY